MPTPENEMGERGRVSGEGGPESEGVERDSIYWDNPLPRPATRRDRLVFGIWGSLSIPALILPIVSLLFARDYPPALAWGILALYLVFDAGVCYLSIMDMTYRRQPFTIPFLSLIYYYIFCFVVLRGEGQLRLLTFFALLVYYALCQHFLPWLWARRKGYPEADKWLRTTLLAYWFIFGGGRGSQAKSRGDRGTGNKA